MMRRAKRQCPLCDHPHGQVLRVFDRRTGNPQTWSVARCPTCRMVYLAEALSYENQAEQYDWSQTFPAESDRRDRQVPSVRYLRHALRRVKGRFSRRAGPKTVQLVLRHKRQGRLCDFGCGAGELLVLLSPHFSVCGIDISEHLATRARNRLPDAEIVVGPVTSARLPAETFDVVTMQSYLEHEQHPLLALRVAYLALKDGGVVVLKTPNYHSWNRRVRGRNWCGFRLPDHCNYFTPETLRLALEKAGFVPLRGSVFDRVPTSDNMYGSAQKPESRRLRVVGGRAAPDVAEVPQQVLDSRHPGKAA